MASSDLERRVLALSPAKQALLAVARNGGLKVGHELVARALCSAGITHVYGVPGVPVYETFTACADHGLETIGAHHQQAAALMAAAHNYTAGAQRACVLVSAGAAAANAVTGALVARDNCWPLVLLAGAVPRVQDTLDRFGDLDTVAAFSAVTKAALRATCTAEIPAAIDRACGVAADGRPGPVLLELPENVLAAAAFPELIAPFTSHAPALRETDVDAVLRRIVMARRPLLIVGKGLRWHDGFRSLANMVDRLALPFITSPFARGYVGDDHPRCANARLWDVQENADMVLVVGARLNWTFRHGTSIHDSAHVTHVDIAPAEHARNRPADMPIVADASAFIRALAAAAERLPTIPERDHGWLDNPRGPAAGSRRADSPGLAHQPIAPTTLAREVARALPRDAVLVLDGNAVMLACQELIPAYEPVCRLTPGSNGCMGMGLPFAMGAAMTSKGRPVVLVSGDFAFSLVAIEFETAVRVGLPIVVVVSNDGGNHAGRRHARNSNSPALARAVSFGAGVRYDRMVEALGGCGIRVESAEGIEPAVRAALASKRPTCIDVCVSW